MHVLVLRHQFLEITELFLDDISHSNVNERNGNIYFLVTQFSYRYTGLFNPGPMTPKPADDMLRVTLPTEAYPPPGKAGIKLRGSFENL
jgi:hypothetical protein